MDMSIFSFSNILILFPAGLGDGILALPTLAALKLSYPGTRIEIWGYPERWEWLPPDWVSRLRSIDHLPIYQLFTQPLNLPESFFRELAQFDLIISWFGDGIFCSNLSRIAKRKTVCQPFQHSALTNHASFFFAHSLQSAGIPISAPSAHFTLSFPDEPARPTGTPILTIHPGSGSSKKCWPIHHFLTVAREAHRLWKAQIVWLFGPADEPIHQKLREIAGEIPGKIFRHRPLREVAALLRQSHAYLGNDSGISHMAGILGVPSIVVFTTTDPRIWKPLGPHVVVLSGTQRELSPQRILRELGQIFSGIG